MNQLIVRLRKQNSEKHRKHKLRTTQLARQQAGNICMGEVFAIFLSTTFTRVCEGRCRKGNTVLSVTFSKRCESEACRWSRLTRAYCIRRVLTCSGYLVLESMKRLQLTSATRSSASYLHQRLGSPLLIIDD